MSLLGNENATEKWLLLLLLPRQKLIVPFLLFSPLFQYLLFLVFTQFCTLAISSRNALFVPLTIRSLGDVWWFEELFRRRTPLF